MKKYKLLIIIFIFLCMLPRASHAFSISAGGSVWFAWWNPGESFEYSAHHIKRVYPMRFIYGPVLIISHDRWSLANVFMYGMQKTTYGDESLKIKKYDLDSTINYSLNRYIRLFMGFKYQHYSVNYDYREYDYMTTSFWNDVYKGAQVNGYGTGMGITFAVPLYQHLYVIGTVSGYYQYTRRKISNTRINSLASSSEQKDMAAHGAGLNTSLSLVYYIEPVSTSVAVGFRYQYNYINEYFEDSFYGFTLAAIYTFDFSSKSREGENNEKRL